MVLALVPTVAFAAGNTIYVDANKGDDTTGKGTETEPYKTVEAAAKAAASGDTITLGEGKYTLYGVSSVNTTKGKNLTFVGQGADKTFWVSVPQCLILPTSAPNTTVITALMAQEQSLLEI